MGLARELVNRIQNLRKQGGLAVTDRIALYIAGDEHVTSAFQQHQSHVCEETLAVEVRDNEIPGDVTAEYEIDGHAVRIALAVTEVT